MGLDPIGLAQQRGLEWPQAGVCPDDSLHHSGVSA